MRTSRLFWKILAVHAALTVLAAGASIVVLSRSHREAATARLRDRLLDSARLLSRQTAFTAAARSDAQELARRVDLELRQHVTFIEPDGTVYADSRVLPEQLENYRSRADVIDARRSGFGFADDAHVVNGAPMLYATVRGGTEDAPAGFVRVGMPAAVIDADVGRFQRLVLGVVAASSAVGLVITWIVIGRITRPLERLTRAARAVAAGEPQRDIETPSRDEIGQLTQAFNAMGREQASRIAELQEQGRRLSEGSELLSTVLGGMIEGVVAVDQRERILFVNPAARHMLDLGEAVVGRPFWESVRNPTISDVVRNALAGRENKPVELQLPRSQTVVALLASRLPGHPCPGLVLVLHDVTDLRRLESLRREFVSNVSHELKTPLASIQACTETLLNGAVDDPPHNRQFLKNIDEQAERLHNLILDLLRLARIESGKDVFELVAVPLEKAIHSSIDAHQALADAKGVTLETEPPLAALRVRGDAEGVRTILDNLIDNAVKYTPPGGRVTVRWRLDGRTALIQVQDTGVGIARAHQDRIFERFYRIDKHRSREMGGTGLGLAIVKHLTQVFDGRVDLVSQPGVGSTFSVSLPLVA